jgi:anti-anti-sigma factor
MTQQQTMRPRTMTMVLEGEINGVEMGDIAEMIFQLSADGVTQLIIDMTEVTHFDFRGVKPLLRRAEVFRELGGDIKLAGLSPYVHAIFRSAGAHDSFDYFARADDAVAFVTQSTNGETHVPVAALESLQG